MLQILNAQFQSYNICFAVNLSHCCMQMLRHFTRAKKVMMTGNSPLQHHVERKREQKYADEILEEKIQCREVLLSQIIDPKLDTRYSIFSRAMELSRLVVKITSKESKPHSRIC